MFVRGAHGGKFAVTTASLWLGDREGEALTSSRLDSTRLAAERPRTAVNYKAPPSSGIVPRVRQHVTSRPGHLPAQCFCRVARA